MKRREFVGSLIAGAGAVLSADALLNGAEAAPLRSPTQLVKLGKTGIQASFLGIGTGMHGWMRASNQTRMGHEAFNRLIRHAYDSGIRLFDCADLYGTHTYLREALKGLPRHSYAIQSKLWWQKDGLPEQVTDAKAAVDRFRTELGTDYIDSILVHCTTSPTWVTDLRPIVDGLGEAKQRGWVRSHGTSCHSFPAMEQSLASPWVDLQFARVNHNGARMDGTPEKVAALLRQMREKGKAVIGMKIFGEGSFQKMEDREASLRFVVQQKCLDAMVIGFEKPAEIDETMAQLSRIMREG